MFFNIIIENEDDLKGEDAGWVSGYFEIGENLFSMNCFKDGKCMIMLTLIDLIHIIINNKQQKNTNWIGADNGKTISIFTNKAEIYFKNDTDNIKLNFELFTDTLKESVRSFIKKCKMNNENIFTKSAFIDLYNSYEEFILFEKT